VEINEETRDRIIAAANQLFEQGGRVSFPKVDAVRRAARANMNDTSAVMKDWRRMQMATATAVVVEVPDRVQQASQAALATLWSAAQDLAREALSVSQAAWDAERAEAEKLRVELSGAFEAQAAELDALQGRFTDLATMAAAAEKRVGELQDQLAAMTERASTAEVRVAESERRAADLKTERDQARDEAARLRGQNEAMQSHQAELMRAITARDTEPGEWRKALLLAEDRLETQTADQSLDEARRIAAQYRDGKPAVELLQEGRMWEAKREQAEEQSHG
jgi:colicin import membrane protein